MRAGDEDERKPDLDFIISYWQSRLLEGAQQLLGEREYDDPEVLAAHLVAAVFKDDDATAAQRRLQGRADPLQIPPELRKLPEEEIHGIFNHVAKLALGEPKRRQVSAQAPDAIADAYIATRVTRQDGRTLHHWDGKFWTWAGTHYLERSEDDQRAQLGQFLFNDIDLVMPGKKGDHKVRANSATINNAIDALKIRTNLPFAEIQPPQWLDVDTADIGTRIAVQNGLLELASGKLEPASPRWFCFSALKTTYDPRAKCPEWGAFLDGLWGDDRQSVETLQEIFGYLLTTDTSQQKAFMLIGPPRSGKGTIGRVLAAILGADATCRPSLSDFGYQFGLEQLIGKSLAIVSDARLDGNISAGMLAERVLAITGEDSISVSRKFASAWNGDFHVRFVILANELPRFRDPSGALPNRFIMLRTAKSFLGAEDLGLYDRLVGELPGILNWAIEGWTRLQIRGHFEQPAGAIELMEQLASIANPLAMFLEECCLFGPERDATIGDLYHAYVQWSKSIDAKPLPVTLFGRDLRAAHSELQFYKPHGATRRVKGVSAVNPNSIGVDNAQTF